MPGARISNIAQGNFFAELQKQGAGSKLTFSSNPTARLAHFAANLARINLGEELEMNIEDAFRFRGDMLLTPPVLYTSH